MAAAATASAGAGFSARSTMGWAIWWTVSSMPASVVAIWTDAAQVMRS